MVLYVHVRLLMHFPEDSSMPMAEKESSDSSYTPPESRRQIEILPLNILRNVLMQKDVAECMIREQITCTMAVAFLSAIVAASGGKVANYVLNAGNASERRGAVVKKMAEAEKRHQTLFQVEYGPTISPEESFVKCLKSRFNKSEKDYRKVWSMCISKDVLCPKFAISFSFWP